MNNGAFGENFPYSNFHDLNMDWIIKIAKDFLDQYTHIQEVISDGEQSIETLTTEKLAQLDEKAVQLEGLLQAWYDEHSEDIALQLANSLAELNRILANNIDAFNTEANRKTAESIASIPTDYTSLSNIVINLQKIFNSFNSWRYNNPTVSFCNSLSLYSSGNLIKPDGQLQSAANWDVYKFDITDDVVKIRLYPYTAFPSMIGCIKYSNGTYASLPDYLNTEGLNIESIFCNLARTHDSGTKFVKFYKSMHTVNTEDLPIAYDGMYIRPDGSFVTHNDWEIRVLPVYDNFKKFEFHADTTIGVYGGVELFDKTFNADNVISTSSPLINDEEQSFAYIYLNRIKSTSAGISSIDIYYKQSTSYHFHTVVDKPFSFNGKTAVFFGDSICYGTASTPSGHIDAGANRWTTKFCNKVGLTETNHGIGSASFTYGVTGYNIVETIMETPITQDFIFICGGVNDFWYNAEIGDYNSNDTTTLYGALNTLISYLNTNYPNKQIIFVLPINTQIEQENKLHPLNDYRQAIFNKASVAGYSVVDGSQFGFADFRHTGYCFQYYTEWDNLHPTVAGHAMYAKAMATALL